MGSIVRCNTFLVILLLDTLADCASATFIVNSNEQLIYINNTHTALIDENVNGNFVLYHSTLFYTISNANMDSVVQYNLRSKVKDTVIRNLLEVSGIDLIYPTLYTLEMGSEDIDPNPRLRIHSLTTHKSKILLNLPTEHLPRALFVDKVDGLVYYALDTGQIMRYDVVTSQLTCLTSLYDIWPTSIYIEDDVLYLYNGLVRITHDIPKNTTLGTEHIEHWRTLAVVGNSAKLITDVRWPDNSTITITTHNQSTNISVYNSSNINNILLVTNTTLGTINNTVTTNNDSSACSACDVCLPDKNMALYCGCSYSEGRQKDTPPCSLVPERFLVFTQAQSLSLFSLTDNNIKHLQVNTDDWYMKGVVYNPRDNSVFWVETRFRNINSISSSEPEISRIMKLNLNSSSEKPVIIHEAPNRHIDSIDLNSADGILYWLDNRVGTIIAAKSECTIKRCIKTMVVNSDIGLATSQLVLLPNAGYMVYINDNNEIVRRRLDGENPKVILPANIITISSITVHHPTKMIYMSSAENQEIVRIKVQGGIRSTVYQQTKLFNPISLGFSGDLLVILNDVDRSISTVNISNVDNKPVTSRALMTSLRGLKGVTSNDESFTDHCSDNSKCEHFCFTLPNGFRCGCAEGYVVSPSDSTQCEDPPVLYISMGGWVQRLHPFSTARSHTIDNVAHSPSAEILAIDYLWEKRYLVWINNTTKYISVTSLKKDNGYNHFNLVSEGLYKPTDISVDWISSMIYWCDELADSISTVSLSHSSTRITLVEHALNPTSLVVHPLIGMMFWVGWDIDGAVIRSARMDGSEVTTIVSRLSVWPTDITVDSQNNRVVWVDARFGLVVSCDPDGSGIQYLVGTHWMQYPIAVSVWYNHIYWVDKHMASVYIAEGKNAENVNIVASKLAYVSDMVLAHADKQLGRNSCSDSRCSHVCIPTSDTTHKCVCPSDMFLSQDGYTCKDLPLQVIGIDLNPYLLSAGEKPHRLSRQQLHNADKIVIHYQQQSIYWIDNVKSAIEMIHLNGTGYRTVYQSTYQATDISIDWLGGNIYWTEAESRSVKCVTLDGKYDKIVNFTDHVPQFILLDPPRSMLFWVECGIDETILWKSTLSGVKQPMFNLTACPVSMAISRQTSTIFWNIGITLHQYKYDVKLLLPPKTLPRNTTQILCVQDNLFVLCNGSLRSVDLSTEVNINIGNTTTFASYSAYDKGFSQCSIKNGGCTHFCFHGPDRVECGCPASNQHLLADNKTCVESPRIQCIDEEFRCLSGECIHRDVVCDGHNDCVDGHDEADCGWCKSYQFSCDDTCLDSAAVCDGRVDCVNRADEDPAICSPCNKSGYTCKITGMCLPWSMKCNGIKECDYGDDERKCPEKSEVCGPIQWKCKDGSCIYREWKCDGEKDCKDGDDELNCPYCTKSEFDCGDGQCVDKRRVCDRVTDCVSGADEIHCPGLTCGRGKKRCADQQCRPANRWCDRVPDCPDKSDERGCNYTILDSKSKSKKHTPIAPVITIIVGAIVMTVFIVCIVHKYNNILPRLKSSYKQLTRSSNKTMETNVCVTTNTFSELDTTLYSSDSTRHWKPKTRDPFTNETMTNSSMSSILRPINTQINAYERFGVNPVQSTTDVSLADGPAPSVASGGYSSGPAPSSHAHSARSRALSARSRATSARSRAPVSYIYHVNNTWDDNINSISDYDQSALSDNYMSDSGYPPGIPHNPPFPLNSEFNRFISHEHDNTSHEHDLRPHERDVICHDRDLRSLELDIIPHKHGMTMRSHDYELRDLRSRDNEGLQLDQEIDYGELRPTEQDFSGMLNLPAPPFGGLGSLPQYDNDSPTYEPLSGFVNPPYGSPITSDNDEY